jgi:quercetin dioxygenase-like cupin family protein
MTTTAKTPRINSFIDAAKDTLGRLKPADTTVAREVDNVLELLASVPPLTGRFPKSVHPILAHLRAALEVGNELTNPLLKIAGSAAGNLPWAYSYPLRQDAPDLEHNIAFAEIIGPKAPYRSESLSLGLTLIAPQTFYPEHRHPAVELYLVLAGTAAWTLDGVTKDRPPGSFILHPSQGVHAMRTRGEPLLALYTWSGPDVRSTSVYINPLFSNSSK